MTDPHVHSVDAGGGDTSPSLLNRVRLQDSTAWSRFVSLYSPLIDHWCRQAGLQESDGQDVRQEVFLAVSGRIAELSLQQGRGKFRAWLRVITRNKVIDLWRRARQGPTAAGGSEAYDQLQQLPAEGDAEDEASSQAEQAVVYRRALELLASDFEEKTWKAFWRVVVDGQSAADVAAEVGLTANAVYLARARVLARLRAELGDLLD